MREFSSIGAFAAHLLTRQAVVALELRAGLVEVAHAVRDTAREELGEYQESIGPFPAWQELADRTKAHHVKVIGQGGGAEDAGENTPLLLTGGLRDSIESEIGGLEAVVGTTIDEGVWMELGTNTAPPRPFLGPAVFHNERRIRAILGAALVSGLLGHGVVSPTRMTAAVID
ncbi:hypothetical protein [Cupriavidus basilensis]|uniref:hypothetical protein n=1 Tax=Cupriavidus basilensis TaxID=68895 RepID=UPI0039F6E8F8